MDPAGSRIRQVVDRSCLSSYCLWMMLVLTVSSLTYPYSHRLAADPPPPSIQASSASTTSFCPSPIHYPTPSHPLYYPQSHSDIHLLFHPSTMFYSIPPLSQTLVFVHLLFLYLFTHPSVSQFTHATEQCCGPDLVWELELPLTSRSWCSAR